MSDTPSPEDMSHAMLLAVLMAEGGSYELPADALSVDALGTADGQFHAVELLALPSGRLRVSVVPRPDGPDAGIERRAP